MQLIIPPQEQNIKTLVDSYIQDFYLQNPYGTKQEEFEYVQVQVYRLPLVSQCPDMFRDVKYIRDYLKE